MGERRAIADCVQNVRQNALQTDSGFTVGRMSEREQMQEQKMPVVAVVLAAGFGTRFDENNPKQLVSVGISQSSAGASRRSSATIA